jgi:hypothetical protein
LNISGKEEKDIFDESYVNDNQNMFGGDNLYQKENEKNDKYFSIDTKTRSIRDS